MNCGFAIEAVLLMVSLCVCGWALPLFLQSSSYGFDSVAFCHDVTQMKMSKRAEQIDS